METSATKSLKVLPNFYELCQIIEEATKSYVLEIDATKNTQEVEVSEIQHEDIELFLQRLGNQTDATNVDTDTSIPQNNEDDDNGDNDEKNSNNTNNDDMNIVNLANDEIELNTLQQIEETMQEALTEFLFDGDSNDDDDGDEDGNAQESDHNEYPEAMEVDSENESSNWDQDADDIDDDVSVDSDDIDAQRNFDMLDILTRVMNERRQPKHSYNRLLHNKSDLFFLISMFTYSPQESSKLNYFNLLKYHISNSFQLQHIQMDGIVGIIANYAHESLSFCSEKTLEENEMKENKKMVSNYNKCMQQISFSNENSIIAFDKAACDYINIISNEYVLDLDLIDEDQRILINCFVIEKGDEMWMGLVHENEFSVRGSIERRSMSCLYYGGRQKLIESKRKWSDWDNGFGGIHACGAVETSDIEPYQRGDWISFMIRIENGIVSIQIYHNSELQHEIKDLVAQFSDINESGKMYFVCTVDDDIDKVFIENARIKN